MINYIIIIILAGIISYILPGEYIVNLDFGYINLYIVNSYLLSFIIFLIILLIHFFVFKIPYLFKKLYLNKMVKNQENLIVDIINKNFKDITNHITNSNLTDEVKKNLVDYYNAVELCNNGSKKESVENFLKLAHESFCPQICINNILKQDSNAISLEESEEFWFKNKYTNKQLFFHIYYIYMKNKSYIEAEKLLNSAEKLFSKNDFYILYSKIFLSSKDFKSFLKYVRKILPTNDKYINYIITSYLSAGEKQLAESIFLDALKIKQDEFMIAMFFLINKDDNYLNIKNKFLENFSNESLKEKVFFISSVIERRPIQNNTVKIESNLLKSLLLNYIAKNHYCDIT